MLNKTEMLIIRACKSQNPQKRLTSVYRRFYYNPVGMTEAQINNAIVHILGGLPESCMPKENPIKVYQDILQTMEYEKMFKTAPQHLSYYMLCYMIDKIRYRCRDEFPSEMIW